MSVSSTHSKATPTSDSTSRNGAVPPLENGDRLSRDEFERRFDAMPNLKKAELIEGVVYVPSPVRQRNHGRPQYHLLAWLGQYDAGTPGLEGGADAVRGRLRRRARLRAARFARRGFGDRSSRGIRHDWLTRQFEMINRRRPIKTDRSMCALFLPRESGGS